MPCNTCLDQRCIIAADGRLKSCPVCAAGATTARPASAGAHSHFRAGAAGGGYNVRDSQRMAEKFMAFHRANPGVWEEIKRMALKQVADGASRISFYDIYEDLRKTGLRTSGSAFKLDNNHTAIYAHMFRAEYPQYADRLELRRSEVAAQVLAMMKAEAANE
jgi:hypothetical protein